MTKAEKIIAALLAEGCTEIPSKSSKYRTFLRNGHVNGHTHYFVGKCGALRTGTCASKSHSMEWIVPRLLQNYETHKDLISASSS